MKGFVFFDLDGTLLNAQSQVDDEVVVALQELKANGYEPFLATGRTPADVTHIMQRADIHSGIFNNGQIVLFHDEIIVKHTIDNDTIEQMMAVSHTLEDGLAAYNESDFRIIHYSEAVERAYAYVNSAIPEVDATFYQQHAVTMLLVIGEAHDHDRLYHERFPELSFFRNSPYSIDVVLKGNSKASGIRDLLHYLQMADVPTYAFGDHVNDLEMFQAVDYPIAMGNAIPEIKAIAAYVTTANTDHGIINGLRHYHLIGDDTK